MIASVRGTVLSAAGTTAIIEVGGVGLQVTITPEHALELRVGAEASMSTAFIVRDDELALYGFRDSVSREVFDLLRTVSGVGPKSAMGVLGAMHPDEIAAAVAHEDDAAFRKVSGIGPKTAKLIVITLAGKLSLAAVSPARSQVAGSTVARSVVAALVGLGWSERVAAQAVDDALLAAADHERSEVQAVLRIALAGLGGPSKAAVGIR